MPDELARRLGVVEGTMTSQGQELSNHGRLLERLDERSRFCKDGIEDLQMRWDAREERDDARAKQEQDQRHSDRRWMIGTALTAAGIVIAAIGLFQAALPT